MLYLALMVKFAISLSTTRVTGYAARFLDLFSAILNDIFCSPKVIKSYDSQKNLENIHYKYKDMNTNINKLICDRVYRPWDNRRDRYENGVPADEI